MKDEDRAGPNKDEGLEFRFLGDGTARITATVIVPVPEEPRPDERPLSGYSGQDLADQIQDRLAEQLYRLFHGRSGVVL